MLLNYFQQTGPFGQLEALHEYVCYHIITFNAVGKFRILQVTTQILVTAEHDEQLYKPEQTVIKAAYQIVPSIMQGM